ncbi:MAG: hypothetical protein J0L87_11360 [Bacteroidetes bacterium]|nr:hypothetical protein [Bacteroidota bacterium]
MSKRYTSLLYLCFLLFAILFIFLSAHSRLATDDYYFIADSQKHGLFEQVEFQYMHWTGRYTATLAMNVFYNLWGLDQLPYTSLPLISILLLFLGAFLLTEKLSLQFSLQLELKERFILSCSFVIMLFFLSYDIGESWFWYCGYSSYLWSIIALLWGTYFLMHKQKQVITGILAAFCFIYIGAASELYAAIIGFIYTLIVIKIMRSGNTNLSLQHKWKIYSTYIFLGIAFLIMLLAPGNYLRDQLFPEHSFPESLMITARSLIKLFLVYLPSKLPYLLALGVPLLLVGMKIGKQKTVKGSFRSSAKKISIFTAIILLLFFWLTAFIMMETGPARVLFFASFIISIYTGSLFFLLGYYQALQPKLLAILKIASLLLLFSIMLTHLYQESKTASNYTYKNDERIALIRSFNQKIQKDTIICLPLLPPSGMLYSAEISNDTSHFTNKELKMGYDLKFHVVVNR